MSSSWRSSATAMMLRRACRMSLSVTLCRRALVLIGASHSSAETAYPDATLDRQRILQPTRSADAERLDRIAQLRRAPAGTFALDALVSATGSTGRRCSWSVTRSRARSKRRHVRPLGPRPRRPGPGADRRSTVPPRVGEDGQCELRAGSEDATDAYDAHDRVAAGQVTEDGLVVAGGGAAGVGDRVVTRQKRPAPDGLAPAPSEAPWPVFECKSWNPLVLVGQRNLLRPSQSRSAASVDKPWTTLPR